MLINIEDVEFLVRFVLSEVVRDLVDKRAELRVCLGELTRKGQNPSKLQGKRMVDMADSQPKIMKHGKGKIQMVCRLPLVFYRLILRMG